MLLSQELIACAMKVDPAQVGHYVENGFLSPDIHPIDDCSKIVGPAFTVRIPTNDNAMMYYAIKRAPAGSVLVVTGWENSGTPAAARWWSAPPCPGGWPASSSADAWKGMDRALETKELANQLRARFRNGEF